MAGEWTTFRLGDVLSPEPVPTPEPKPEPGTTTKMFRIWGDVPPEIWNRLGTKILPKLRRGSDLKIGIEFSVTIDGQLERTFEADLKQIFDDLGLTGARRSSRRTRLDKEHGNSIGKEIRHEEELSSHIHDHQADHRRVDAHRADPRITGGRLPVRGLLARCAQASTQTGHGRQVEKGYEEGCTRGGSFSAELLVSPQAGLGVRAPPAEPAPPTSGFPACGLPQGR